MRKLARTSSLIAVVLLCIWCSIASVAAKETAQRGKSCKKVQVHGTMKTTCHTLGSPPPRTRTKPHSTLPAGAPRLVVIPRIGVRANMEPSALRSVWDFHAPHAWWDAAWYSRGPRPGEQGRALVFGHLDSTCCPALFWNLGTLKAGDTIAIAYRMGRALRFRVAWKNVYWNNARSIRWVYQHTSDRVLVLTTCTGTFYPGRGYDRRLLVYAHLIGT